MKDDNQTCSEGALSDDLDRHAQAIAERLREEGFEVRGVTEMSDVEDASVELDGCHIQVGFGYSNVVWEQGDAFVFGDFHNGYDPAPLIRDLRAGADAGGAS